ncbi:MAG: HDOD domain-containing protein [Blastochloris sp.]|nr:HDOD domain-containing protein [Blastochloris sp.]
MKVKPWCRLRFAATKEYAYGLLNPKFSSWAENAVDPNLVRKREDTLNALQKPMKPLKLPGLVKSLKDMLILKPTDVEDLMEALDLVPQVDDFVAALAQTGFARKHVETASRRKAIRAVGTDLVSQLVLTGLMLRDDFQAPSEFVWTSFWQHAVSTGVVAHYLMQVVEGEFTPGKGWDDGKNKKLTSMVALNTLLGKGKVSAYLGGLIHDIGKPVMAEVAPYPYYAALRAAIDEQSSLYEMERRFLGIDHAELGQMWLSWNGINGTIQQAVAEHHDLNKKTSALASTVALANQLVKVYGMGYSGSPVVDQRNVWKTRSWTDLQAACRNPEITPELMEEHFVPLVGHLPLFEPLPRIGA